MRIITFARNFPSHMDNAGEPTYFVEKIIKQQGYDFETVGYYAMLRRLNPERTIRELDTFLASLDSNIEGEKLHTIRKGYNWKGGEMFQPKCWSGLPYRTPQIKFIPDIEIKWTSMFDIDDSGAKIEWNKIFHETLSRVAMNDGLTYQQFLAWFKFPQSFAGQIICWSKKVNYKPKHTIYYGPQQS